MALRSALGSRLDSKEPDWTKFQDFLKGEVHFASLLKQFPAEAEENAKWRYKGYVRNATI
jgi:pyruvate-ferredoxin/flavodoxin oxidoreductase